VSEPAADQTMRLYAIAHANLGMGTGKLASQCGHAFTEALLHSQEFQPARFKEYRSDGMGTKVALSANSTDEIHSIKSKCDEAGIPATIITDSGCANFFNGAPTITAIGVGPAKRHEVKKILGRLKLIN